MKELKKLTINPYPTEAYHVNAYEKQILEQFPSDNILFQEVSVVGRIMGRRIMGADSFVEIMDSTL